METTFHLLRGTLRVEAQGYWYSGGGAKGSFGYYPCLKDDFKDRPVIADTQIHGDLRMAAMWAKNLGVDATLLDLIFGKEGNESAALLHVGDLRLAESEQWDGSRFQIKPRIEIDDASRTVRDKMLANFELAWLNDLTLGAPLYLGYFTSIDDMTKARSLLDEAVCLLSGFGAFRSRGYGRGRVSIVWADPEQATFAEKELPSACLLYTLESLVNVRSKPVAAEKLQLLETALMISSEQIRGWFVRTFHKVTGRWPDIDEMADITFSDFYPSLSGQSRAFPPPVTTLRKEDNSAIDDYWGKMPESRENITTGENYSEPSQKLKPLKPGTFLTKDRDRVFVNITTRMRNRMECNFLTREGGLFVQQYLPQKTFFSGEIRFNKPGSSFSRLAYAIISGIKPTINGNFFSQAATPTAPEETDGIAPRLVTTPIAFHPDRKGAPNEGITVGTSRRYSPVLARPRRGRPVILPGSVMIDEIIPGTIYWPLFGQHISTAESKQKDGSGFTRPSLRVPLADRGIDWKKITRSQAGILRELNTEHNHEVIGKYLRSLRDKHVEKQRDSDLAKLYTALVEAIDGNDQRLEKMRDLVRDILEYLKSEIWWQEKARKHGTGRNLQ